ncbi:MAG: PQQ-binding-like beta-propeller repeat protein [Acidobacteriota bacterium]
MSRKNLTQGMWIAGLLACLVAIPATAEMNSELWPQWRGPQRDGSAGGAPWPDDLSCLEQQWRVELGPGYPGPIVTEDRVFVAETHDKKREIVRALDRASGRELWRAEWEGSWKVPFFASRNGSWIRATPAWDGQNLYVGGIREVLVSLKGSDGTENWRLDLPAKYDTEVPHFGFATSPLIDGEHLYVQAANSLIKLNKGSGEVVWRSLQGKGDISMSGAFSSPVIATLAGRRQLVAQTRLALHGVDLDDGAVLWSQPVPHFRGMNILTPTVWGDAVFTSSYRNGSYLYRVSAEGESFAVKEAWQHKAHGYMSSPTLVGDHVYLHLGNQRLTCLDLATGKECWTSQSFGKYWSQATQGDKILALDEEGELHLVRANPEQLELLDSRSVSKEETWGHLAVAGNELFIRELEAVAAYRWCRADNG